MHEAQRAMNEYGKQRMPFLFIIDFELQKPIVIPQEALSEQKVHFTCGSFAQFPSKGTPPFSYPSFSFEKQPLSFTDYAKQFYQVHEAIHRGDSFLVNLTAPTAIQTNLSLKQIYLHSQATYKLWLANQFVCFSPETFITISAEGTIATFPMKGTIDANLPNAAQQLLQSQKEMAEHATIVDLLRNDLSQVARNVRVSRFRYLQYVKTHQKDLLQMSSEITGQLPPDFTAQLGDLLFALLPAGSISGAPKYKTLEIIQATEKQPRGYYTGVFGYFDGCALESAVMIRYIEQINGRFYYRSGGGIHAMSHAPTEYQELIDKIYVPIYRDHPGGGKKAMELAVTPTAL